MSKAKELLKAVNEVTYEKPARKVPPTTKEKDWFLTQDKYETNITNWGVYLIVKKPYKEYGIYKDMDGAILKALELEGKLK